MAYRWAKDVMAPAEYEMAMACLERAQGKFQGMWTEYNVPLGLPSASPSSEGNIEPSVLKYTLVDFPHAEQAGPEGYGPLFYRFRMQKLEDNFKQTLFCVTCKDLIMVGYS